MIDLDKIYENLDKMASMKRVKLPTPGYFPEVSYINTYAKSKDFEYMLPYLLWLDENLSMQDREVHKEAVARLREIVEELEEEE